MLGCGVILYRTGGFDYRLSDQTRLLAVTGRFDMQYVRELEAAQVPDDLTHLGATNRPPKLLVWGDSHAMSILPVIDTLCRESGVSAVAATHAATPPVIDYFSRNQWGLNERSIPYNAAVMHYLQTGTIRTVILVSSWKMHAESPEFQAALIRTVEQLQAAKVSVALMKEIPTYDFNVERSLVRLSYHGQDLTRLGLTPEQCRAEDKWPPGLLQQLAEHGVRILDPLPILRARSRSERFLPYDANGSFYFDYFHLSTYGALALRPLFAPVIDRLADGHRGEAITSGSSFPLSMPRPVGVARGPKPL
jgi:hypothetical protein